MHRNDRDAEAVQSHADLEHGGVAAAEGPRLPDASAGRTVPGLQAEQPSTDALWRARGEFMREQMEAACGVGLFTPTVMVGADGTVSPTPLTFRCCGGDVPVSRVCSCGRRA